jgi:hypothetical protein
MEDDHMATVHFVIASTLPPERILAALTDFSPERLKLYANIDQRYYQVHLVGKTEADVTEGTQFLGGVWERVRYDWSQPGLLTISTKESNAFTTASFWRYEIASDGNGGSRVAFTLRRVPKNAKGRVVAGLLRLGGRPIFRRDLRKTLAKVAASGGEKGMPR